MMPARSYRYALLVIAFVWTATLPFLYQFDDFSADSSWRKWSFHKEIVASFCQNKTNSYHSNFQIDIQQTKFTEDPPAEKLEPIDVLPGLVPLEPTQIATVVYGGDSWLFECQTACKETITVTASKTETVESKPTPTEYSSPPSPGFLAKGIPVPFANRDGSESVEIAYLKYLISGLAFNNTIIIAPTNTGFIRLALNFNCRMRTLGVTNVLYWALDDTAAEILREYRMPVYHNPNFTSVATKEAYHSEKYLEMMSDRPKFWRMVMKTGFDMLFLDVDNIVIKNPLKYIIGDVDLETQVDEKNLTTALDIHYNPKMCGGAFFLKSNGRTLRFLDRMEQAYFSGNEDIIDDQRALNFVIHNQTNARIINRFEKNGKNIPIGGYAEGPEDDRILIRFVPVETFMNGHVWRKWVQTDVDRGRMTLVNDTTGEVIKELDVSMMHLNGIRHKETYMRDFGWWNLNDDLTCHSLY